MDGSGRRDEPWLVELQADAPGRLDLDKDVVVVSALWDLGTTGVTEIDGRLVAGFADRERAVSAAERLRSLAGEVRARPVGNADVDPEYAGPPSHPPIVADHPSTVRFVVGGTTHSIAVAAGPTFGHGHHPTTKLALHLLGSALDQASAGRSPAHLRVLDVGTGSGVLAVAAAKAGAGLVVAVDADRACESVVAANAGDNGVKVDVVIGDIETLEEGALGPPLDADRPFSVDQPFTVVPFDVIVCNLLLVEHSAVAETVDRLLASDGHLVLSGYLMGQTERLLRLHPGLDADESSTRGDWIGHRLVGRHRPSADHVSS